MSHHASPGSIKYRAADGSVGATWTRVSGIPRQYLTRTVDSSASAPSHGSAASARCGPDATPATALAIQAWPDTCVAFPPHASNPFSLLLPRGGDTDSLSSDGTASISSLNTTNSKRHEGATVSVAVKPLKPPPVASCSRIPLFSHQTNVGAGSRVGKESGGKEGRGRGESVCGVYKSNSREQAPSVLQEGESGRRDHGHARSPLAVKGESGEGEGGVVEARLQAAMEQLSAQEAAHANTLWQLQEARDDRDHLELMLEELEGRVGPEAEASEAMLQHLHMVIDEKEQVVGALSEREAELEREREGRAAEQEEMRAAQRENERLRQEVEGVQQENRRLEEALLQAAETASSQERGAKELRQEHERTKRLFREFIQHTSQREAQLKAKASEAPLHHKQTQKLLQELASTVSSCVGGHMAHALSRCDAILAVEGPTDTLESFHSLLSLAQDFGDKVHGPIEAALRKAEQAPRAGMGDDGPVSRLRALRAKLPTARR